MDDDDNYASMMGNRDKKRRGRGKGGVISAS